MTDELLPVELVFAPAWWHRHAGLTFDEDFFYNPLRRVEVERQMERELYERWGRFGLGRDCDRNIPVIGPVHLAAGYLLPEMLGCEVHYRENAPPEVVSAGKTELKIEEEVPFRSPVFQRFSRMKESLKARYGNLTGDVNWGGVLNIALDLRGQHIFEDMYDRPDETKMFLAAIGRVIERFVTQMESETGTSSISVNRTVRHFNKPVTLHSECSHTMISVENYETFLLEQDIAWSRQYECFGVHYCGADPHRYAGTFAKIPGLKFLDVGWGGDVKLLRQFLPGTFLNIRLSPVEILKQTPAEIASTIRSLVSASGNAALTGLCCINMDDKVTDDKVTAILETVADLRAEVS